MKNYYTHKRISPTMLRIDSPNESAYLVEGTKQAVLIDSCSGAGSIGDYARSLTKLPLFLILTHGHLDHIGGAMSIPTRYLNSRDWEMTKEHGSYEVRKAHLLSRPEDGVLLEDIMPDQVTGFLPLEDEQVFDLGEVHLKALPMPGHTLGSMVILHVEERSLLLGDACNPLTFLFFPNMPCIEAYQKTLISFQKKWRDAYDTVLFSHFEKAGTDLIDENIRVCDDILAGTADDQPFQIPRFASWEKPPVIAKKIIGHPKLRQRADGKSGNIVYRKDNVFLPGKNRSVGKPEANS